MGGINDALRSDATVAGLIIAKAQANFESLDVYGRDIFSFLRSSAPWWPGISASHRAPLSGTVIFPERPN